MLQPPRSLHLNVWRILTLLNLFTLPVAALWMYSHCTPSRAPAANTPTPLPQTTVPPAQTGHAQPTSWREAFLITDEETLRRCVFSVGGVRGRACITPAYVRDLKIDPQPAPSDTYFAASKAAVFVQWQDDVEETLARCRTQTAAANHTAGAATLDCALSVYEKRTTTGIRPATSGTTAGAQ